MEMVQSPAMAKASKRVPVYLTEAQAKTYGAIVNAANVKSFSELVRELLKQEAGRQGIEWPDDANEWILQSTAKVCYTVYICIQ